MSACCARDRLSTLLSPPAALELRRHAHAAGACICGFEPDWFRDGARRCPAGEPGSNSCLHADRWRYGRPISAPWRNDRFRPCAHGGKSHDGDVAGRGRRAVMAYHRVAGGRWQGISVLQSGGVCARSRFSNATALRRRTLSGACHATAARCSQSRRPAPSSLPSAGWAFAASGASFAASAWFLSCWMCRLRKLRWRERSSSSNSKRASAT